MSEAPTLCATEVLWAPMAAGGRILLVDDMASIHEDFRKILLPTAAKQGADALDAFEQMLFDAEARPAAAAAAGFTVDSAYQGRDALQMLLDAQAAGQPYAMAFVDMRMPPGWDGVETVEHLWRADPALQVVICTAYSDYAWDDVLDRLRAHERLLILKKPFDTIEVRQLAHTLTAKWAASRFIARHTEALEAEVRRRTAELEQANARLREELEERQRAQARLAEQADQIRHLAFHDRLTGLANRALLYDRLAHALAVSERQGSPVGLMFLDLDHFKPVNDTLGHAAGDALLQAVAQRLSGLIREGDTAARIGGDEFVLVFENLSRPDDLATLAQRLLDALARPVRLGPHSVGQTGGSIGIACAPRDGRSVDELMRHADLAMYAAKSSGRQQFRFYDPAMASKAA